jgi:L-alanine-DL-glutamate epimerase-like enolase superfamily enzyme
MPHRIHYNIEAYLAPAVRARRNAVGPVRRIKTAAEERADDDRFAYDANRGWSYRHRKTSKASALIAQFLQWLTAHVVGLRER